MARLVLSDASPLVALSRLDGLVWLHALFGTVAMPRTVHDEVLACGAWPGQEGLREAVAANWLRLIDDGPPEPALPDLDEGEAACIRCALRHGGPALILMDERAGRAVAREQGLQVAGTAAVIGMAKQRGLIASAREMFADLLRSDFRLSPEVIRAVLQRVGERA
jgi:predicted nucleic acid-binding protein